MRGFSGNITINAYPIPTAPSISRNSNNFMVSSANYGNNWYLTGANTGDTSASIRPTIAGPYSLRTIQQGCVSPMSGTYYYLVTSIENISSTEFIKLSPNPFINKVNIDFVIKGTTKLNLEIFDVNAGAIIVNTPNILAGSTIAKTALPSGIYLFRLYTTDKKITKQFKMIKL